MIKKSVFEDELILGMHHELVKNANNQELDDVTHAVDYLNSAIDIFEDAGLHSQADQVLNIIKKIATIPLGKKRVELSFSPVMEYAFFQMQQGTPTEYIKIKHQPESPFEWAQFSDYLRNKYKHIDKSKLEKQLEDNFGKNYLNEEETNNILIANIEEVPYEISGKSILKSQEPEGEFLSFKSIASKRRPKDPRKISDRHTKGLTSKKMVENLKHHGTPFNLADTHHADDLEVEDSDSEE